MTCSGDQKVTIMILKVDLQCCQCYKKVKKILCKFPQIRDQMYDEKNNTVTITVVCCSPERIRDKLCCKGRKTIKSIEIKKPAPPPEPEKPKPKPKPVAPAPAPAPAPIIPIPVPQEKPPKPAPVAPAPAPAPAPKPAPAQVAPAPAPAPAPPAPKPTPCPEPVPQWVPCYPPIPPPPAYPIPACCSSCSEGRPGGPCYQGGYGPAPGYGYQYERPLCPPGFYAARCDYYTEDNPSACSIM